MKYLSFSTALFLLVLFSFSSCNDSGNINDINWIIGEWKGTDVNDLVFHEVWENDGKNSYTGLGATVTPDGDTILRETLKINVVEGTLYYIATIPKQKGPVFFRMIKGDAHAAVFTNLEHDFPQSISYTLQNNNKIEVKLEGLVKGNPKTEHLIYERVLPTALPPGRIENSNPTKVDSLPKEIKINL